MSAIIRWAAAKISNHWDFASFLVNWLWTIGSGLITGWAASVAGIFPQYSPLSWVAAGLMGALVASLSVALIGIFKNQLARASAITKWKDRVENINPLDKSFHSKRILLSDLTHPISRRIEAKKLTECDLIGPANIILNNGCTLFGVSFMDCDIVVIKHGARFSNATLLDNVEIIGGFMWRCTLMVPPDLVETFVKMGAAPRIVTLTGRPEIDNITQ